VKIIRIAGRGQARFRARYTGTLTVREPRDSDGMSDWRADFPSHSNTFDEGWTAPVNLTKDVNIFYIFGGDYQGYSFVNTILEARVKNELGLLKYMSSPF